MQSEDAFSLAGKVALITGSSRGIGEAMARDFAAAGASVVVTARALPDAERVAESIRADGGVAKACRYEAGESGSGETLRSQVVELFGHLDILVNNAAILRPHFIEKLTEEEFDEVFNVNTRAALFLSKACLPLLKNASSAAVVNVTAAGAHRPMEGIGTYCASKAAMINFTQTLAKEWARWGVRVNALTPGTVATEMILPRDPEKRARFEREIASQNLMNRLADPKEIATAARFLVCPAASYVTGQTLIVDGGFLA